MAQHHGFGWQLIGLKLLQKGTNRDGLGSWIETKFGDKVLRREITSGGGHVSGGVGWWHFGLGGQTTTEVRVLWPDGVAGDWQKMNAGEFYILQRGKLPKLWHRP